jgi:hypothetical protein
MIEFEDTLAAIEKPLNDCEVVSYILSWLNSEYDSFVTTITTWLDPISMEELYGHLLTSESQLEQQTTVPDIVFPSANVITKSNKNRGSDSSHYNSIHGNSSTWSKGRGRDRGRGPPHSQHHFTSNNLPSCQVCGKTGHTTLKCYRRFDRSFKGDESSSMATYMVAPSSQSDLSWYPNTVATNHMTADLNNLNLQADEYTGSEQVRVGNGQGLKIAHYGASNLLAKNHICLPNMLHVPQLTKNLFFIHKFAHDNNAIVEFHYDLFYIKEKTMGTILLQGSSKDGLYPLIPST